MNANHEELMELGTVSEDTHSNPPPGVSDTGALFKAQAVTNA